MKLLTIWIPTYCRPKALASLLDNIDRIGLTALAEVVVSDNEPPALGSTLSFISRAQWPHGTFYRRNSANLSAGVNFLRGFEDCRTPWLMIVGDDDLFSPTAATEIQSFLSTLPDSVFAVKFDSSLFGKQANFISSGLVDYVAHLDRRFYANAYNNLCFISNWLFRCEPYRQHLASAYLGYSSKISHLFPLLRACSSEGGHVLFSSSQPVLHGTSEGSTWPKAATWYEMVMTLTSFTGFIDTSNRQAILRLLLHADWRRTLAKCIRVHQFYGRNDQDVKAWRVHIHLASCSFTYLWLLLLVLPLLLLPPERLPRRLLDQLGDPGSVDRW